MSHARRPAVIVLVALAVALATTVYPASAAAPAASGARPPGPFSALDDFEPTGAKVRVDPTSFAASRLDVGALRSALAAADAGGASTVAVPDPAGKPVRFTVVRTRLMQSQLAAAHPEIATYSGHALGSKDTIALDLTPMGFHASVRGPGGQRAWYVDPAYNRRGTTAHLSYYGAALPEQAQRRAEGEVRSIRSAVEAKQSADAAVGGGVVTRRFYRLALTSDPSYAAYFGTENVLAEKVTLINRVNQIYNDDLGVSLRLVNATDSLNLDTAAKATGANGPCGAAACFTPSQIASCGGGTLGRNRTVLGQLVGASRYDIGHLALGVNGGGIAYLQVVGGDYKGGGCTGLPFPEGDFFAIDYVAHEMGHQFGGDHTFNGALGACGGNIADSSVEPGSGSSVMAYAGICAQDDLQPHTDPYFSFRTLDQVNDYISLEYDNIEVQTVSLRGFDTDGETIALDFPGSTGAITLTRGTDYTTAGVEAAVETLTGEDVSIARWGFDEFSGNPAPGSPNDTGFQVIFNDEPTILGADETDVDLPSLEVSSSSAGVSGFVGETAQGGPAFNAGSTTQETSNHAPNVIAPADKTIPVRTPFALTGSGTDADGQDLVYLWEQTDFGDEDGTPLAENAKTNGPLFRVFGTAAEVTDEGTLEIPSPGENQADGSPTRVFPDLAQVLAGNTNAATGTCPAPPTPDTVMMGQPYRDCFSEFLPIPGYVGTVGSTTPALHFRLTARDRYPNGGGVGYDEVTLSIDPTKGPFAVTSQATAGSTTQVGASLPITWSVNGTNTLAPQVRITLSTDGGATWGQVLAASTPNDGSETVVVPNATTTHARIRIEAVDNYFFDTNDADFTVAPAAPDTTAPDTTITSGPKEGAIVLDEVVTFAFTATETPATFACAVDGTTVACDASGASLKGLKAGTHTFSVAASDAAGNADATPATRTFTVPYDDGAFKAHGTWKVKKSKKTFGGDYSTSKRSGDKLVRKVDGVTSIVLVVSTGKNLGPVKVFLGKKLLKTVKLDGKNKTSVLKSVATFPSSRSGTLKLVVGKNKEVRIEGVALVSG